VYEMTAVGFNGPVCTVHRSRFANCSALETEPAIISSSHRRPRAIALTRRARRSARSGRIFSLSVPCGRRILWKLLPRDREDLRLGGSVRWLHGDDELVALDINTRDQCSQCSAIKSDLLVIDFFLGFFLGEVRLNG
jgi:hypothetical protein